VSITMTAIPTRSLRVLTAPLGAPTHGQLSEDSSMPDSESVEATLLEHLRRLPPHGGLELDLGVLGEATTAVVAERVRVLAATAGLPVIVRHDRRFVYVASTE